MEKNKLHRGLLCGNCVPLSFKKKKMKKKEAKIWNCDKTWKGGVSKSHICSMIKLQISTGNRMDNTQQYYRYI